MKFLKKIGVWFILTFHSIMTRVGIALYATEMELLKADPNELDETKKKNQRKLHRNQVLEKFYAGQTDEKYVKEYYEILKGADKFLRDSTSHKIAVTADKHGSNLGKMGIDGNYVNEHFGFFDDKHKNKGKTLGDVLAEELKERRTNDDDYELIRIFNNTPIEVGLPDVFIDDNIEKKDVVWDVFQKSKQLKFPLKVIRENENIVNKIEELTEFIHVKKVGFDFMQLEFFIPLKFKTNQFDDNSDIILEIINFNNVYMRDQYGELIGYKIVGFSKRITHNDTYDVFKFDAHEMEMK